MGYYVNLVFDLEEVRIAEEAVRWLQAGGCTVDGDLATDDEALHLELARRRRDGRDFCVGHPEVYEGLCVSLTPSEELPGYWASTRFSWGMRPHEIRKYIGPFFEIARKAGARVYDGRFHDDLDELMRSQARTAEAIRKMLGEVAEGDAQPDGSD